MNDSFVVLMGFWKAPSKWNSFRGLGGVFGSFSSVPVLLFLMVEELSVGNNPGCIFWFWACHVVAIKFSIVPAFIVAGRMSRVIDHGRGIVNIRAKGFVPISVLIVVFVGLVSKRKDKLTGVKGVIHRYLRQ